MFATPYPVIPFSTLDAEQQQEVIEETQEYLLFLDEIDEEVGGSVSFVRRTLRKEAQDNLLWYLDFVAKGPRRSLRSRLHLTRS